MTTITTRSGKGSPLTNNEVDANFTNLNDDKVEASGDSMTGNLSFGDNNKAIFGSGNDLQIYHDPNHSIINESGTGSLKIQGDNIRLQKTDGSENMITAVNDGAVTLFYDNTARLATTSTGIDVTGSVVSDGLTVDASTAVVQASNAGGTTSFEISNTNGVSTANNKSALYLSATGAEANAARIESDFTGTVATNHAQDLKFYYVGVSSSPTLGMTLNSSGKVGINTASPYRTLTVSGDQVVEGLLEVTAATPQILFSVPSGGLDSRIHNDGSGNFIFGTGTNSATPTERMRIDSAGNVGIGTSSPANLMHLEGSSVVVGATQLILEGRYNGYGAGLEFVSRTSSGGTRATMAKITADGEAAWNTTASTQDAGLRFSTTEDGTLSEKVRILASGNVGIGTQSPAQKLTVSESSAGFAALIKNSLTSGNGLRIQAGDNSGDRILQLDDKDGNEKLRVTALGNVGIGTASPSSYNSAMNDFVVAGSADSGITIASGTTSEGSLAFADGTSGADAYRGWINYNHNSNFMRFSTNATERLRIHNNGRVSIGSSPSSATELFNLTATSGNGAGIEAAGNGNTLGSTSAFYGQGSGSDAYVWNRANNTILFGTNNTECARFSSSGDMEIGSNRVNQGAGRYLDIYNAGTDSATFAIMRLIRQQVASSSLTTSEFYARKNGETAIWNHESNSAAYLRAGVGVTEGWRIHSSGNVLLGKSSPAFGTAGVELNNAGVAGKVHITRSGGEPLALNRLSSDGSILEFYKDGSQVGLIGNDSNNLYLVFSQANNIGLAGGGPATIFPVGNTGAVRDNAIDLGYATGRFDDIYATNGTIQTSDRNEKQDIEELSDAEQRVAVACKGLLRKFRWKSSVEEKGEDARIHFGIIAQDLQDAFTAEGLDAGRYGMFINSTWTDEETGEERSRMGVRYSELLAFIISAI